MKMDVFQKMSMDDLKKYDDLEKGVVVYDMTGDIVYANKYALSTFGYASVEDLPNGWNFIPPEYKIIIRKRIEKTLSGEILPLLTLKIFTGDRRIEIIKSKIFAILLNGKRMVMAMFTREIEDRYRRISIEEALKTIKVSVEPFLEGRIADIEETMRTLYDSIKGIFSSLDMVFVKKNLEVLFTTTDEAPCKSDPLILKCMEEEKEIYISFNEIGGKIYTLFASPVFVDGEVFGAVGFRKEGYGAFAPEDVEIFRAISELASLILRLSKKIKDIEEENENLFKKVMIDDLTGSYTRNYLNEFVKKVVSYFKRNGEDVSVIMMDIDNLKTVNDNYGHLEGDKILHDFAKIVMRNIRETDFLIRLGGDEFLLVLPGSNVRDAENIMERIVKDMESANEIRDPKIYFSYGIALIEEDLSRAINLADDRMYAMKRLHHDVL